MKTKIGSFTSIRAASNTTGIQEPTISQRLRLEWTHDQALELDPKPKRETNGVAISCRGKTYKSISAFSRAFEKNTVRTRKRLKSGWNPEQAVGLAPKPPRYRNHQGHSRNHFWKEATKIDGALVTDAPPGSYRLYLVRNKKNDKEYVGITTGDLKARLRGHRRQAKISNMSHLYKAMRKWGADNFEIHLIRDDALDFLALQQQEIEEINNRGTLVTGYNHAKGGGLGTSKSTTVDGQEFPSRQSAAMYFKIDPAVFNLRLNRLGWTPEEAAELKKRPFNRHKIEVEGKSFKSLKSAAEAYGLDYKLVHDRFKGKGWTYLEALGVEPPPRVAKRKISYKGKNYESLAEFARAFGLEPDTVSARLSKGKSYSEAVKPLMKKRK